jgi:hypothetical protein
MFKNGNSPELTGPANSLRNAQLGCKEYPASLDEKDLACQRTAGIRESHCPENRLIVGME